MTIRSYSLTAVSCLVVASAAIPVAAQTPSCDGDALIVDLAARTVAGIFVDVKADSLTALLGADRVTRTFEVLETEPSPMYVIDVCDHTVHRHWNGLSWTDPAFLTTEGRRVGMSLAAFDSTYGLGRALWSEAGVVVAYPLGEWEFFAEFDPDCIAETDESPPRVRSRACPVTGLWIPLQTLPD